MSGSADFSADGRYRYTLARRWSAGPTVCFVMLNPSTADAVADDPTIRRCIGFARVWGFGALVAVNLFALRATHPLELRSAPDPVGRRNDRAILAAARAARHVVLAWGADGAYLGRGPAVLAALERAGLRLWRLGALTAAGQPRHPLYVPGRRTLVPA